MIETHFFFRRLAETVARWDQSGTTAQRYDQLRGACIDELHFCNLRSPMTLALS